MRVAACPSRYGVRNSLSAGQQLLGTPMAADGQDDRLDVVGDELHRVPDTFTRAFRSADRQHRESRPPGLAPFVLRDDRGECAVELKTAAQRLGIGSERTDVVVDHVGGQLLRPGRRVELRAEEDLFTCSDELLV